ncbi:hypothetical protein DES49_3117, partial [Halospina denitrificans]
PSRPRAVVAQQVAALGKITRCAPNFPVSKALAHGVAPALAIATRIWLTGFPVKRNGFAAMFSRTLITMFLITVAASALGETASQETPPRLIFAQKDGDKCEVGYWHRAISEPVILARTDECPERLFIDQSTQQVLFADAGSLLWADISPGSEVRRAPLPDRKFTAWRDQMNLKPEKKEHFFDPLSATMEPTGGRFLKDGTLTVLMELATGASPRYKYIFHRADGTWSIAGERYCWKGGCEKLEGTNETSFKKYVSTGVWDREAWPVSKMPWHPELTENQFVTDRKENFAEGTRSPHVLSSVELDIKVEGEASFLKAFTRDSAHGGPIHTMGIKLRVGSGPSKVLSKHQCMTSIVGHYILVDEFFSDRFELTDLGTGKTVLGNLSAAAWID